MKYLVDSNVLMDLYRGDSSIVAALRRLSIEKPATTTLNYAEILFGLIGKPEYERIKTDLCTSFELLSLSATSAEVYAHLKLTLQRKGRPIPEMDVLIASIALEHSMTLITRDKHFASIDGLKVTVLK
jgi:tRNA(fMet)-specific endonuclease VapC